MDPRSLKGLSLPFPLGRGVAHLISHADLHHNDLPPLIYDGLEDTLHELDYTVTSASATKVKAETAPVTTTTTTSSVTTSSVTTSSGGLRVTIYSSNKVTIKTTEGLKVTQDNVDPSQLLVILKSPQKALQTLAATASPPASPTSRRPALPQAPQTCDSSPHSFELDHYLPLGFVCFAFLALILLTTFTFLSLVAFSAAFLFKQVIDTHMEDAREHSEHMDASRDARAERKVLAFEKRRRESKRHLEGVNELWKRRYQEEEEEEAGSQRGSVVFVG